MRASVAGSAACACAVVSQRTATSASENKAAPKADLRRAAVGERGGRDVLDRHAHRLEDRHVVLGAPSADAAGDHLANLAEDVVRGDAPLVDRKSVV